MLVLLQEDVVVHSLDEEQDISFLRGDISNAPDRKPLLKEEGGVCL